MSNSVDDAAAAAAAAADDADTMSPIPPTSPLSESESESRADASFTPSPPSLAELPPDTLRARTNKQKSTQINTNSFHHFFL